MAEIRLNGVAIDTEDIDLLVEYCPIATLQGCIEFERKQLQQMPEQDSLRSWLQHRMETHELALDIAQRLWDEGITKARQIIKQQQEYHLPEAIMKEARRPKRKAYQGIVE